MSATFVSIHAAVVALATAAVVSAGPRIEPPIGPGDPVRLTGLTPPTLARLGALEAGDWPAVFAVYVDAEEPVPPMLGEWSLEAAAVIFRPRFPFLAGQPYRVVFDFDGRKVEEPFRLTRAAGGAAGVVARVYPTSADLPANLIRFYVYFSRPMRGGDVYRNIHLTDADGVVIDQAFVETIPELWDPGRRRVTLICHPGRIKQGLQMHERHGPPLRPGETFRLVVDPALETADGNRLDRGFEKTFRVSKSDRVSTDPSRWNLAAPAAGSRDPLRIEFDEALDHAQLARFIGVESRAGEPVAGSITVTGSETVCLYRPESAWAAGEYAVIVYPALEDVAGNRVDMTFDRKMTPPASERTVRRLAFTIAPD